MIDIIYLNKNEKMCGFKDYLKLCLSIYLSINLIACSNDETTTPPNIIFILADDLGYGDLACYGHPYAKTPNIDKLSKEGILFEKFYAAGVTCSPSRTAFMTGKHPATFQKYMSDNGFGNRIAITQLLKEAGYATAHIGKWHIGPKKSNNNSIYGIDLIDVKKPTANFFEGKDADIFDTAIEFIKNNKKKPFYINVWGHTSHFPIDSTEFVQKQFMELKLEEHKFGKWFNKEKLQILKENNRDANDAMKMYLGEIFSLDIQIGKLLKCLEEQNLVENTILVFSSDQGPDPVFLESTKAIDVKKRLNMLGYAGGLRGGKHNQYEGGVRVPFIVRWPEKIRKDQIDKTSVISALDFLPTLCSIIGIKTEKNDFDGMDKSAVWFGKPERRQEPLFWKVHANEASISILDNKWKMHKYIDGQVELFDLESDPYEEKNLSKQNQRVVEELEGKINRWDSSLPKKD